MIFKEFYKKQDFVKTRSPKIFMKTVRINYVRYEIKSCMLFYKKLLRYIIFHLSQYSSRHQYLIFSSTSTLLILEVQSLPWLVFLHLEEANSVVALTASLLFYAAVLVIETFLS